MAEAHAA